MGYILDRIFCRLVWVLRWVLSHMSALTGFVSVLVASSVGSIVGVAFSLGDNLRGWVLLHSRVWVFRVGGQIPHLVHRSTRVNQ